MIAFLLNVYLFAVWLVYFKLKWLKFDTVNKIVVGVLGVLFVFGLLIMVNFLHPMTMDARVYQHVVQIATRTTQPGRVVEVPVRPNEPLKKGDVLFRLDPRPYQYEVDRLTAALTAAKQSEQQLKASLASAQATVTRVESQRKLAATTLDRDLEVQSQNSGALAEQKIDEAREQFAVAEASLHEAQQQVLERQAALDQLPQSIAQVTAELATAKLNLEEVTVTAPSDGVVTVLELRPGFVVSPGAPVMTFVVNPEGVVAATLAQEYAAGVAIGNEVELCLDMYPGETLRGTVEAIIQATGEGQLSVSGLLPTTGQPTARARIPIKIRINEEDLTDHPLPAGAGGAAAIYTDRGVSFQVVRRVMLRWYTWLNYLKLTL